MAVTLVHTCPHCGTERAGFTLVGESGVPSKQYWFHAFFHCNTCFGPVIVVANNRITGRAPSQEHGDIAKHEAFSQVTVFPKTDAPKAPEHAPEASSRAFVQAEDALKRMHWEAAGAMDRRALEIATKEIEPAYAKLGLYQRIEKLSEEGLLTTSLKEWAHDLRLVGNDAAHEIEGITQDEAIQAHMLARFILIYLYTLPIQVEEARKARENGN